MQGVLVFITEKTMAKMFNLLEIGINKLPPKLIKEKENENEVVVYQKIVPPKALVNWEGWKVTLLRKMYVVRLPALIQVIWLKGSWFTYVAKKLMNFVMLNE